MARGRFITEFEKDCIRIGKANGLSNAQIARALERSPAAITQKITEMTASGTMGDVPFTPVCEDIAAMLEERGARK